MRTGFKPGCGGTAASSLWRALFAASERAMRRKRNKGAVAAFRLAATEHLVDLHRALSSGEWQPRAGFVFVTHKPKHREIHAARFEDRVVHHLIMGALGPELDRRFSPASFACRAGKGTHAAARALRDHLWHRSRHGQIRVWVLRMDVKNFFHSIHLPTLQTVLERPIRSVIAAAPPPFDLTAAVAAILRDRPGLRAQRQCRLEELARVPEHKRLSAQAADRGLPIGNLTSQWFANAYLDGLDQFVQRQLGFGAYVRYMDDFVVCATDPDRLELLRQQITAWLHNERHLQVHGDWPLVCASHGVDFVGHIVRPGYALLRRRVVVAAHERLWRAQAPLRPRRIELGGSLTLAGGLRVAGPAAVYPLLGADLGLLRGAWASIAANLRHAAGRGLAARLWTAHPLLQFHLAQRKGRLRLRWAAGVGRPPGWPDRSLRSQLQRLVGVRRDVVVLVHMGAHVELLRATDWRACRLRPHRLGKGRFGAGVPLAHAPALVQALLARGRQVLWVAQLGTRAGGLAERTTSALIMPLDRAVRAWRYRSGGLWPAGGRPRWQLATCAGLSRHSHGRVRPRRHPKVFGLQPSRVVPMPTQTFVAPDATNSAPAVLGQLRLPFGDWWAKPGHTDGA